MAYYVRPNRHPRERAELRIVIKVREGQRGGRGAFFLVESRDGSLFLSFWWEGGRVVALAGRIARALHYLLVGR